MWSTGFDGGFYVFRAWFWAELLLQSKRFWLFLHISPQRGLSVCLSYLCTLLQPLVGFRGHLVASLEGANDTVHVRWGPLMGSGRFGGSTLPDKTCHLGILSRGLYLLVVRFLSLHDCQFVTACDCIKTTQTRMQRTKF